MKPTFTMQNFIGLTFLLLSLSGITPIAAHNVYDEICENYDSLYVFNAEGGIIPDFKMTAEAVIFEIEIEGVPQDADIGLVKACLSVMHKRTSDLKIELKSPSGNSIWLSNRNGGIEGRNYSATCFSASGFSGYIHEAEAPFDGDFIPDGRFEFLNLGNPNGTWKLLVYDLAADVEGVLTRVSLSFGALPQQAFLSPCSEAEPASCLCPEDNQPVCPLLPDLILLEEFTRSTIKVFSKSHSTYPNQLRFSVSIANLGHGPFEIELKEDQGALTPSRAQIRQVIYQLEADKLTKQRSGGGVIYYDDSPGHDHYHVDNWVAFSLFEIKKFLFWEYKEEVANSRKVSFCLFDSGICDGLTELCRCSGKLYGPNNMINYGMGSYISCNQDRQGISVGGYDTYGYSYEGQYIDLPVDLSPGKYELKVSIDPEGQYQELTSSNNSKTFTIDID